MWAALEPVIKFLLLLFELYEMTGPTSPGAGGKEHAYSQQLQCLAELQISKKQRAPTAMGPSSSPLDAKLTSPMCL